MLKDRVERTGSLRQADVAMDGNWSRARDVPFAAGVRGVYGNPALLTMRSIHKCVAKNAPHLFH